MTPPRVLTDWLSRRRPSNLLPKPRREGPARRETHLWLMWRKFRRHRAARIGGAVLGVLLLGILFAPFIAPYAFDDSNLAHSFLPPQRVRFVDEEGTFH